MKKTIIILVMTLSVFACKAQTIYGFGTAPEDMEPDNIYIKDINNDHDLIVGTWKWEDGDNSFEITLQEFEMYNYPSDSDNYFDAIFGKYKYIEDGNVVSETSTIESYPNIFLTLNFYSPTIYNVVIKDVVSNKHMVGQFVIISSNIATFNIQESQGIRVNADSGIDFTLPTSVTLTKQ